MNIENLQKIKFKSFPLMSLMKNTVIKMRVKISIFLTDRLLS